MAGDDWARYWRADGVPVEAMHAHFTSHVYHRHSHESYSFGVTETGAQAFTCRHGRHVSASGMVMAFNPDDPHDGHAAVDGGFTYRMVHIWPEFLASLTGTPLPLFRSPVIEDPAMAASVRRLHRVLTGPDPKPANSSGTSGSPGRRGFWSGTPRDASQPGAGRAGWWRRGSASSSRTAPARWAAAS
jgi:AraC-like ligand binding domain.